jgi:hypothetical protein
LELLDEALYGLKEYLKVEWEEVQMGNANHLYVLLKKLQEETLVPFKIHSQITIILANLEPTRYICLILPSIDRKRNDVNT